MALLEQNVLVTTKYGKCPSFAACPDAPGSFPGIILYMDAPGYREELCNMARRIATVGYYVILPNLYYRQGRGVTLGRDCTTEGSAEFKRMFELMGTLSNQLMVDDTATLLKFLDGQPAARKARIGALGYCMSGPFAVTAAAHFPDRIAAAASYHGVFLATDKPDSPHLLVDRIQGEVYLAFGEKDHLTPPAQIDTVRAALDKTDVKFEIEVYPGAGHGFVFPDRANYIKPAAERHWETLFELFGRTLQ